MKQILFVLILLTLIPVVSCDLFTETEEPSPTPTSTSVSSAPTISSSPGLPTPAVLPETRPEDYKYKLHIDAIHHGGTDPAACDIKVEYYEKRDRGEGHGIVTLPYNQAPFLDPFTRTFSVKSHGCPSMAGGIYHLSHWELDGEVVDNPVSPS